MGRPRKVVPSKETLQECYYRNKNINKCASEFSVSYETFRMWLITRGIEINQQGVNTNVNRVANKTNVKHWFNKTKI